MTEATPLSSGIEDPWHAWKFHGRYQVRRAEWISGLIGVWNDCCEDLDLPGQPGPRPQTPAFEQFNVLATELY